MGQALNVLFGASPMFVSGRENSAAFGSMKMGQAPNVLFGASPIVVSGHEKSMWFGGMKMGQAPNVLFGASPIFASGGQDSIAIDFAGSFRPELLELIGTQQPCFSWSREPAGLRFCVRPKPPSKLWSFGLRLRRIVVGDFEITADYRIVDLPKPGSGFGAGPRLEIGDDVGRVATLRRIHTKEGVQQYGWQLAAPRAGGDLRYSGKNVRTDAKEGRLRLRRKGTDLEFLIAPSGSEQFEKIHAVEFGDRPVPVVRFVLNRGGAETKMDVVLTRLTVNASQLDDPPPKVAVRGPPMWPWAASGVVVIAACTALIVWWRKR
jgi:hypothetical protein